MGVQRRVGDRAASRVNRRTQLPILAIASARQSSTKSMGPRGTGPAEPRSMPSPDHLDDSDLTRVVGGQTVRIGDKLFGPCTLDNPTGEIKGPVVKQWSGRYCDGPQTFLKKNAEYAHRMTDITNGLIQFDMAKVIEAQKRGPGIACGPSDIANTR